MCYPSNTMQLFFLSIFAGFLTVIAPCILPVLPVVLGVGRDGSKWRPFMVVCGFIFSFGILGAFFATTGTLFGVSQNTTRLLSVFFLSLSGISLLFENLIGKAMAKWNGVMERIGGKVAGVGAKSPSLFGGLLVGLSLGLVWTPCAGPILGTIIAIATSEGNPVLTMILFSAYAFGAGIPLLAIAYSGDSFFNWLKRIGLHAKFMNKLFGILVILTAISIAFGYDRVIQSYLIQFYPSGVLLL